MITYIVRSVLIVRLWSCLELGAFGKMPDALLIYDNGGTETNGGAMANLDRDGRAEYIAAVKSERLDYLLAYGLTTSDENRPKPVPIDGFIPKSSPDGKLTVRGPEIVLAWGWDTFNRGPLWVLTGDFNGDAYPDVMTLCSWGQWKPYRIGVFYRDPGAPFPCGRAHELSALWNIRRGPVGAPKPDIPIPKESPWRKEGWLDDRAVQWATGYSNPMRVFPGDEKEYVAIGNQRCLLLGRNEGGEKPPGRGTWNVADVWDASDGGEKPFSACAIGDLTGDDKAEIVWILESGEIRARGHLGGGFPGEEKSPVEVVRSAGGARRAPFDGALLPESHPAIARNIDGHPSGRLAIGDPSLDGKNELILAVRAGQRGVLLSYQRSACGPGVHLDGQGAWDFEVLDLLWNGEVFMDALVFDYDADGTQDVLASTSRGHIYAYRRAEAGYGPGNVVPLHDYLRRTLYEEKDLVINSLAAGDMDGDPKNGHEIAFSVFPGSPQIPVPWGHYLLYNTTP